MSSSVVFQNLRKKPVNLVVSPLDAVKRNAEGKKERLSVMEESEDIIKRNSIMSPSPRLSDERRESANRRSSLARESLSGRSASINKEIVRISIADGNKPGDDIGFYSTEDETIEEEYDPYYIDPYVLMLEVPPYEMIPKSQLKRNLLPAKSPTAPSHTLVLDLDETLIHCELEKPAEYDISFVIKDEYDEYEVYLSFRPYVFYFLETMSQYFELVVFTAGIKPYAEIICSLFNNDRKLIHYCLSREHCVLTSNGMYIKDLRCLNRDLSKTVILDNSPYAFAYNVDNGAPIDSWYSDKKDKQLYKYIPVLKMLSKTQDVCPELRRIFGIEEMLDRLSRSY